jgi:hypothetical protein
VGIEHRLALAAPDECGVARKGGWYSAVVPPFVVELLSWPKWPELSSSMVWL